MNFPDIRSPVIFRGDYKYAYRDPAVVYHEGIFHLYFTLSERTDDGGYYNMVAMSKSRDLVHWTYPNVLTPHDRALNYSSPGNIVRIHGQWIMCLQTYPTPNKETFGNADSRVWICHSQDLAEWGTPELLRVKGDHVPVEEMGRMIDPYLIEDADEPGKWWCFYKQSGVSISISYGLDQWTYVGRSSVGENVTVLRQDDEYVMFHSPSNGIGVKRSQDLAEWCKDVQHLTLGQANWPWAKSRLTAATVIDLTTQPDVGKYVMFFHGSVFDGEPAPLRAHGEASVALAWSDDLVTWHWPGSE